MLESMKEIVPLLEEDEGMGKSKSEKEKKSGRGAIMQKHTQEA